MLITNTVHVKCIMSNYVISKKLLFEDPNFCGPVLDLSCLTAHKVMEALIFCFCCSISFEAKLQLTLRALKIKKCKQN